MGSLPSWLNPFDFIIVLALLGGTALGFIRGLVRMALNLLVLYLAVVLAMTFYDDAGRWIRYASDGAIPEATAEVLAFILILILTTALVNFVLSRTYKDTELPGIRQIDQLGGMLIGFVLTCTWIGLAIIALAFILGATGSTGSGLRYSIVFYFESSNLIPIFYKFLPIIIATLRPWMPKGLPPDILTLRLP
jgi:uncharacterized membrane protein required for colicin V production